MSCPFGSWPKAGSCVSVQWDMALSQAVGGVFTSLKLGMSSAWQLESQDAESTANSNQGGNLPLAPGLDTEVVYFLLRVSFW